MSKTALGSAVYIPNLRLLFEFRNMQHMNLKASGAQTGAYTNVLFYSDV